MQYHHHQRRFARCCHVTPVVSIVLSCLALQVYGTEYSFGWNDLDQVRWPTLPLIIIYSIYI
jgi:hypothetical protein